VGGIFEEARGAPQMRTAWLVKLLSERIDLCVACSLGLRALLHKLACDVARRVPLARLPDNPWKCDPRHFSMDRRVDEDVKKASTISIARAGMARGAGIVSLVHEGTPGTRTALVTRCLVEDMIAYQSACFREFSPAGGVYALMDDASRKGNPGFDYLEIVIVKFLAAEKENIAVVCPPKVFCRVL